MWLLFRGCGQEGSKTTLPSFRRHIRVAKTLVDNVLRHGHDLWPVVTSGSSVVTSRWVRCSSFFGGWCPTAGLRWIVELQVLDVTHVTATAMSNNPHELAAIRAATHVPTSICTGKFP